MSFVARSVSTYSRVVDPLLTVLVNGFALLILPGIVAHELGHYAACRLVGAEVKQTVLFHWPEDPVRERSRGGWVSHDEPAGRLRSGLIRTAPLASNTAGALAAFYGVREVVGPSDFAATVTDSGAPFGVLLDRFLAAGLPDQILAGLCLWVGLALAYCGFPSAGDLREFGRTVATLAGESTEQAASLGYYFEYARGEASVLYTVVLTIAGLAGVRAVFDFGDFYLALLLTGVPLFLLRKRSGSNGLVRTPVLAQLSHVDRIEKRADAGQLIPRNDVESVVELLDRESDVARNQAGLALWSVASNQPALVAEWEDRLFEAATTEERAECRTAILSVLLPLRHEVDEVAEFAAVGSAALTAADERVRVKGAEVMGAVALAEPRVLTDHVDELVAALETLPEKSRANSALALALVAEDDPDAVDPHRDRIREYRDDENSDIRERVQRALTALAPQ